MQSGSIEDATTEQDSVNYHLYVQWIAEEQMQSLSERMRASGVSLYLDLPLGVNAASYDVYSNRDAFVLGAAGGCPPDIVFRGGQNWGFPPMHPQVVLRYVLLPDPLAGGEAAGFSFSPAFTGLDQVATLPGRLIVRRRYICPIVAGAWLCCCSFWSRLYLSFAICGSRNPASQVAFATPTECRLRRLRRSHPTCRDRRLRLSASA